MKLVIKSLLFVSLLFCAQTLFAQNLVEDGAFFLKEEQYSKAIDLLKVELSKQPNDAKLNFLLGEAYFALGQMAEAKSAFMAACSDLKSPFGSLGLGKMELQNGNRVGALLLLDKAIKLERKNPTLYATVAKACLEISKPDTAAARIYLERGAEITTKNAMIQMVTGDLNLIKKNYGIAANDYERVFLYDKSNYEAYRNLGVLFTSAKNFADAKKNFEQTLLLAPNQILGYKKYSELYYNYGKFAEAEKYYTIYYSKVTPTINEVKRYAFILFFNKKYKEASTLLDQVMKEKGDQVSDAIYRIKGYICYETNDVVNGLDNMNKLFALKDSSELLSSDYTYYARLLSKNSQDSLAIVNFKIAIGKEENALDILEELAKVYARNKMYADAVDTYSTIIVAGGDKASGNFNIGKMYYQAGDEQRQKLFDLTPLADSKGKVAPMPKQADSVKVNMVSNYTLSDSCFAIVNTLSPSYATGYLWRGRIHSILDPESKLTTAKDFYEKTLEVLNVAGDKVKSKRLYMECYNYLGSYYFLNSEREKGAAAKQLKEKSISYFTQILEIEPTDAAAKDKIEKLNAPVK